MLLGNTNSVAENLYYLLWIKDSGLQETSYPVRIPDTILVNGRQITSWYFTGSNGSVLKKKAENLHLEDVYESFVKFNKKSGIIAQIIYGEQNHEKLTKIQQKLKKTYLQSANDHDKVLVRYLNEEELHNFLFEELSNQDLDESLILQKFIDPYGDSNNCIQAIWSPSTCIFTKRINNRNLNDTSYDPYERAVTYDGPEIFSKAVCLKGKQISGEMRRLCENIVKRIAHVTYERNMVNRMTLYFKADQNNKLYFLFCTSLRLKDEIKNIAKKKEINPEKYFYNNTPLLIDNNFQRPPNMKNTYSISTTKPIRLQNDLLCLDCEQMLQHKDMMEIPFSYLLKYSSISLNVNSSLAKNPRQLKLNELQQIEIFKNQLILQNNGLSNGRDKSKKLVEIILTQAQIMQLMKEQSLDTPFDFEKTKFYVDANQAPSHPLLAKLYPKMTKNHFSEFVEKGNFDSLYIKLCHNCYYFYTQNSVITGAQLFPKENLQEINSSRVPKQSTLFTPEMHKISLEKSYELSKQFDFVRYQRPEVYEQRLNLLYKQEQIKKSTSQPKIFKDEQKQNYMQNQSERSYNLLISEKQPSIERNHSQETKKIQSLFQQQKQKQDQFSIIRNQHSQTERLKQTNILSSLLDITVKQNKRFDLLVNLATKNVNKKGFLSSRNSQRDLIIQNSQHQQTEKDQLYLSSAAHSSKQTDAHSSKQIDHNSSKQTDMHFSKHIEIFNDDSFSKIKNNVLDLYLNQVQQNNLIQKEEFHTNRINSPINLDIKSSLNQTPDKNIPVSEQFIQSEQAKVGLSRAKQNSLYLKNQNANSKNEVTTANSYRSTYSSSDEAKEKISHQSPKSFVFLTSKSQKKNQFSFLKDQKTFQTNNSENSQIINNSQFNRPFTTQNASQLHIIKESSGGDVALKTQRSPYLPYKQSFIPFKQQSATNRSHIQKDKFNKNLNLLEENKQLQNRSQKSFTSYSQRPKIIIQNKRSSIDEQNQIQNEKMVNKNSSQSNISTNQNNNNIDLNNQNEDTYKNNTPLVEISQFNNIQINNDPISQNTNSVVDIFDDQFETQRADSQNQLSDNLNEIYENQNPQKIQNNYIKFQEDY